MKVVAVTIRCEMCNSIVAVRVDEENRPLPSPSYTMVPMLDRRGRTYYGLVCTECRHGQHHAAGA